MTLPERWRKSRASVNTSNCVELSSQGAVRDSKNPTGPRLTGAVSLVTALKIGHLNR
jgi:hypothetical protein